MATVQTNKVNVEAEVGYVGARLREKSTYGGLAFAVGLALPALAHWFPQLSQPGMVTTLVTGISYLGMGLGIFIGVFLPENGSPVGKIPFSISAVIAFLAVGLFASHAFAADLPGKAPPAYSFTSYPTKGCGPYYGLGVGGTGNAVTGSPAGTTMLGGDAGMLLGYTCTNGTGGYWFGEGRISAQGLSGTTINAAGSQPLKFQEKFAFGGPLPQFFTGIFPNLTIPAVGSLAPLPGGVTVVGPAMPYLYVAADQNDISAQFPGLGSGREWQASFELGIGMLNRLSDAVVSDTSAGLILQSLGNGLCIGPNVCPKIGMGAAVQQSFKF